MFDIHRFLEDCFGSPDGVVGLASTHGIDVPSREAVRKWFARGAIPAEWMLTLLLIVQRDTGCPVDVSKFIKPEADHGIFG